MIESWPVITERSALNRPLASWETTPRPAVRPRRVEISNEKPFVDEASFLDFLAALAADRFDEVKKERLKPSPPSPASILQHPSLVTAGSMRMLAIFEIGQECGEQSEQWKEGTGFDHKYNAGGVGEFSEDG